MMPIGKTVELRKAVFQCYPNSTNILYLFMTPQYL